MKREVSFFSLVSMLQKGKLNNNNNNKKGPKTLPLLAKLAFLTLTQNFKLRHVLFASTLNLHVIHLTHNSIAVVWVITDWKITSL